MTDYDDWTAKVTTAMSAVRWPKSPAHVADRLWPYVGRLTKSHKTLADVLYNETMPSPDGTDVRVPTLTWLTTLNPYVRREVVQIQAALKRLQDEHDARAHPPHQDVPFTEGVAYGLTLALHIMTNGAACNEDECHVHEAYLLTETPLVPR